MKNHQLCWWIFIDHEIKIIINIISKVLDKYIKENDKKINLIEFIKKVI